MCALEDFEVMGLARTLARRKSAVRDQETERRLGSEIAREYAIESRAQASEIDRSAILIFRNRLIADTGCRSRSIPYSMRPKPAGGRKVEQRMLMIIS